MLFEVGLLLIWILVDLSAASCYKSEGALGTSKSRSGGSSPPRSHMAARAANIIEIYYIMLPFSCS